MKLEYRQIQSPHVELRASADDEGTPGMLVADVLTYGKLDDYGTTFHHEVFSESLQRRMPRIVWGHNWLEPIGRWVEADNTRDRLRLLGQLDVHDDVPMAKRAYYQLKSGTIDQFSVGFQRTGDMPDPDIKGATRITKGSLDEVSPVLVGAVPGTALLAVRSGLLSTVSRGAQSGTVRSATGLLIPADAAAELAIKLQRGEIDLADALQEIKHLAVDPDEVDPDDVPDPEEGDEPVPEPVADAATTEDAPIVPVEALDEAEQDALMAAMELLDKL